MNGFSLVTRGLVNSNGGRGSWLVTRGLVGLAAVAVAITVHPVVWLRRRRRQHEVRF